MIDIKSSSVVRTLWIAGLAIAIIVSGPMASSYSNRKYQKQGNPITLVGLDVAGWKREIFRHNKAITPRVHHPDAVLELRYTRNENIVDMYIYAYSSNKDGKEIINHENTPYDKKQWVKAKQGLNDVKGSGSQVYTVNEELVSNGNSDRLVHYFYRIRGEYMHSPYRVKMKEIMTKIFSKDLDSRLYVFSTEVKGGVPLARNILRELELAYFSEK